jgi:glycosyltransferase involved in cell wall biosynthesis
MNLSNLRAILVDDDKTAKHLRIVELGSTAYHGGVSVAVKTLAINLRRQGHDVVLVCDGGNLDDVRRAGVTVVTLENKHGLGFVQQSFQMRKLLKGCKPDIVHVHSRRYSLLSYLAGRKPDFFTLHNTHFALRSSLLDVGLCRRLLSPLGRRILVLNKQARTYMRDDFNIPDPHIVEIGNGVDCDAYFPPNERQRVQARRFFSVDPSQTLVLFVGRLHPSKQPEQVLSLARVCQKLGLTDVRFAIVGDGEQKQVLGDFITAHDLNGICKIHGWLDPKQAYHAADLLVMPSLFEGFPLVAIEAMACGVPVIRSRSGGEELMMVEGRNGYCCETSEESFIATTLPLLKQPQRLHSMRAFCREHVLLRLTAAQQAKLLTEAFMDYLQNRVD